MPQPAKQLAVCPGCGAVSTEDGKPLDNRCKCEGAKNGEPSADRLPIVAAPLDASVTDPVAKVRNHYAVRVLARYQADTVYLIRQQEVGHAIAATEVCKEFDHDARAGLCMRCGVRLGRDYEED